MLRDNLYHLVSIEKAEGACKATVELIPGSEIYAAHFRGMPVTPGACLVGMVCELSAEALGHGCEISRADDIKFVRPVLPGETSCLDFSMVFGDDSLVRAEISDAGGLFAKMKIYLR